MFLQRYIQIKSK